jgi:hypothetical protein
MKITPGFYLFLFVYLFPVFHAISQQAQLKFTENAGQWESQVLFRAQLDGGALFMEPDGLTFDFYDKKKYRALHHGGLNHQQYGQLIAAHAYKIRFKQCNPDPLIEKENAGADYENFFLGNDPEKWTSHVANFKKIWYRNLYPGVDYEIEAQSAGFKYNFHVKKNADPAAIQLQYEGVNNLRLENEVLHYELSVTDAIELKPYAYQVIGGRKMEVACRYHLAGNMLSFQFPNGYDRNRELVIDPVLVFAAQSGSFADNFGMTATWDAAGNFYSGGTAFNNGYPVTTGAYSLNFNGLPNGSTDVVITKYNSTLTALLYSTYFGGTHSEIVSSMIVDHSDNLCFYGATSSTNFPVTAGAYDVNFNGGPGLSFYYNGTNFINGTDMYVAKFNSGGGLLLGSTYLGGSNNDGVNHVNHLSVLNTPGGPVMEYAVDSLQFNYGDQYRGEIQVDAGNNIYIAGTTRSSDFPTVNAADATLGGKQDAVVAKFNSALTQLLYCTYIGGSLNDCGNSLIVNDNFEVYLAGGTCSSDFPATAANGPNYNGGKSDGYIVHLNSAGNGILQATYVGTYNYDQVYFIQSDRNNSIYVYGQSLGNMPVFGIPNPISIPGTHQFITRYNNTLGVMNMSTVFGSNTNNVDISPSAFSVDDCGFIYISGWGGSIVPPVTVMSSMPLMQPTQATTDGNDFYVMILSPGAGSLLYGSYFGGALSDEHVDGGTSRIDKTGAFYQSGCAGCGGYDDFPVTPGAWPNTPGNPNHSSNCNNGVFKLRPQTDVTSAGILANTTMGCAPLTVSLSNVSSNASGYLWYLGPGVTNSTTPSPVLSFTAAGNYTVSLVAEDPFTCNTKDSTYLYIQVSPGPSPTVLVSSSSTLLCEGEAAVLTASGANAYSWISGSSSASTTVSPSVTTSYTVTGTNNSCTNTAVYTQSVVLCVFM